MLTSVLPRRHGVEVINTVHLHSTESDLRFKPCLWYARDLQ